MSESNGKPAWAEQLTAKYKSGVTHTFSLHFNVNDYADHTNLSLEA